MKKPLVSVITTTLNEEKSLAVLLKSIQKQTYKNLEIIVVDNPKTRDKTRQIAKKYTEKVYIKGPQRSAQRNFGVTMAQGDYVLILDADMELTHRVVESCMKVISSAKYKALIIPERTVGDSFMAKVRRFEREMYIGDSTIEVARFFEKGAFNEFGGYDPSLTGTEDYDLPYRISRKYSVGWAKEYILHHEEQLTLAKQLEKKYFYAAKSASYADKHPELIATQGNMLFRKAYFRNWKKFAKQPILGLTFIFVRTLEASAAVFGYISAVGLTKFLKVVGSVFRKKG